MTAERESAQRFGLNLKAAREHSGMSQTALAEHMRRQGFSAWRQTTVSRTERGERDVKMGEGRELADLFGDSLQTGTGVPDPAAELVTSDRAGWVPVDVATWRRIRCWHCHRCWDVRTFWTERYGLPNLAEAAMIELLLEHEGVCRPGAILDETAVDPLRLHRPRNLRLPAAL